MASRVNLKFVFILSAALAAVFLGVAGSLVYVKYRSGERYVSLAERALADGDIEKADNFYARAVGKEPTNVAWLTAWRDVRTRLVPETQTRFQDAYVMYIGILRSLALAQRTNVQAHRDYLQAFFEQLPPPSVNRDPWDGLTRQTEAALRFFEPQKPPGIRRYRGLALANLIGNGLEVEKDQPPLALEDLTEAAAADPKDFVVGEMLRFLHRVLAAKAAEAGDPELERTHLDAAQSAVAAMIKADPENPLPEISALMQEAANGEHAATGKTAAERTRARIAGLHALRPRAEAVQQKLLKADPAVITSGSVESWLRLASATCGEEEGLDMAIAVMDRALAARPADPDLLVTRAIMAQARRDYDGAIALAQRLADLPNPAVSRTGAKVWAYRSIAAFIQANAAATMVLQAPDQAARDSAMPRARSLRQALAIKVPADSPRLKFIDGKLKFAEGDTRGAQRLLTEFVRAPGDAAEQVTEAVAFLVDVGTRTGELGLKKDSLLKLRTMRPGSPEVLMALAGVQRELQEWGAAASTYEEILAADPDHAAARAELSVVQAILGKEGVQIDDPVMRRLAEAQRAARGDKSTLGDDQRALRILEEGLEPSGYDLRLIPPIVQLQVAANNREGALAVIQAALAKHPDNSALQDLLARVEGAGTLEGNLKVIDSASTPELEKWLARRSAYEQFGKAEEALGALAEAEKLAPGDIRVLQFRLDEAIGKRDFAAAEKIAEAAARAEGESPIADVFKAQVLYARGNTREALAVLQRASERANAPADVYRLRGQLEFEMGRTDDAIVSLQKAHDLVPTNIGVVKALMQAMIRAGRQKNALDTARASLEIGRRDPAFMNAWLSLEAGAGNTQLARDRREQLLAQSPADHTNKAELVTLYMEQKAWEQARTLLDQLKRDLPESTFIATLDARWYAERADLEGAMRVLKAHLGALQAKQPTLPPDPYIAIGHFLMRYGQPAGALDYYRQGEALQDPKAMPITVLIGETLFASGQYAKAQECYRRVLAAAVPDPGHGVRKRLIDCLNQQRRYADAEQEFAALGGDADADADLMCQHAQTARGMGDRPRARQILDRAVAKFPQEASPFLWRARLVMTEPAFVQDALDDLGAALRLRPGLWQALRTRSSLYRWQGKTEDAMRDLRAAVEAVPGFDALRFQLIEALLADGQEADAVESAAAALRARPNDLSLKRNLAERFARAGRAAAAARYYKMYFEQVGTEEAAGPYLAVLLAQTPPALNEAMGVLQRLPTARSWPLLLFRAQAQFKRGAEAEARTDIADSLSLVETEAAVQAWYPRFRQACPDVATAADVLSKLRARGVALEEWLELFRASVLLESPATASRGLELLRGMLNPRYGTAVRLALCRTLFGFHLANQTDGKPAPRWEDARKACEDGLAVDPGDAEMNNNLAFLLSEQFEKASEALPHAETAAKAAPDNYAIVDTLASVYRRLGQAPRAVETLTRALTLAPTDADRTTCALKLARWKLEAGDRSGAAAMADMVAELLIDNPGADSAKADLDQLNKDLRSAPR